MEYLITFGFMAFVLMFAGACYLLGMASVWIGDYRARCEHRAYWRRMAREGVSPIIED